MYGTIRSYKPSESITEGWRIAIMRLNSVTIWQNPREYAKMQNKIVTALHASSNLIVLYSICKH